MTVNNEPTLFDLPRAEKERDTGIESVAANNEDFLRRVRAHAVMRAQAWGYVSADELRAFAAANDMRPTHPNAWGAVFKACPLGGYRWEPVGHKKSRIISNHARRITIWKLVPIDHDEVH